MTYSAGAQAQRSQFNRDQYTREAILSATPVRLLTLLYDRLLLDLGRAEAAQVAGDWSTATGNLVHAQAIVAELSSTLDVGAWDGGEGLLALYTYVSNSLISANIHRDVERTRESVALLEPLRQTWHEAAAGLPASPVAVTHYGGTLGIG